MADVSTFLWRSHFANRIDELTARKVGAWQSYLGRGSEPKRAGAQIITQGHMHLPMAL